MAAVGTRDGPYKNSRELLFSIQPKFLFLLLVSFLRAFLCSQIQRRYRKFSNIGLIHAWPYFLPRSLCFFYSQIICCLQRRYVSSEVNITILSNATRGRILKIATSYHYSTLTKGGDQIPNEGFFSPIEKRYIPDLRTFCFPCICIYSEPTTNAKLDVACFDGLNLWIALNIVFATVVAVIGLLPLLACSLKRGDLEAVNHPVPSAMCFLFVVAAS